MIQSKLCKNEDLNEEGFIFKLLLFKFHYIILKVFIKN